MANIKPFCGYRYNPEKINNMGEVTTPPYDMISGSETDAFYNASEYNIIRAVKGKEFASDTGENNCYTRAGEFFRKLIEDNIIIQDPEPAFYLYEQRVDYNDTTFVNHGIVALVELSELDKNDIFEQPSVSVTDDRYRLITEVNAHFDMINCIYNDPEKSLSHLETELEDKVPDMEFITQEKVIDTHTVHRIWTIKNKSAIDFIQNMMKEKTLFITNGHNRYVTALQYSKYCRENDKNYTKNSGCNFIPVLCTNSFGNRMVQLPVHRMISNLKKFSEDWFIAFAQDYFRVEKIIVDTSVDDFTETMKKQIATARKETRFGFYCGGNYFYRLTLNDKSAVKALIPDKSDAYCNLDVTVFNKLILESIFNIAEDAYDQYVTYTKRSTKGVEAVKSANASCLFILNPTKAEQIIDVTLSGEAMPDRSIYVFPKPATGVIIYKF